MHRDFLFSSRGILLHSFPQEIFSAPIFVCPGFGTSLLPALRAGESGASGLLRDEHAVHALSVLPFDFRDGKLVQQYPEDRGHNRGIPCEQIF